MKIIRKIRHPNRDFAVLGGGGFGGAIYMGFQAV